MITKGKGALVWKLRGWKGGNPQAQVQNAIDLGLDWLCIKVQNGELDRWEGSTPMQNWDLLPALVPLLHAAGILVTGWGWLYGRTTKLAKDMSAIEAAATLRVMARLVDLGGADEFWMNAETYYKNTLTRRAMGDVARSYHTRVRAARPSISMVLCSYKFPTIHSEFPFSRFLEASTGNAPEVYWESETPVAAGVVALERTTREYNAIKPGLKMVPIGPAYAPKSGWRATPAQFAAFYAAAKANQQCQGVGMYAMDEATPEQIAALGAFEWQPQEPPPTDGVPIAEWAPEIDAWARTKGYTGPKPEA